MTATLIKVPKKKVKNPPLKVCKLGDRNLRQPAKRVSKVNDEIRAIAVQMLQTMYSDNGIGLAAPQVGINKQIIVIDCDSDNQATPPLIMINPEVKAFGGDTIADEEGCLSVPDVFLDVQRRERITVTFRDEEGKPQTLDYEGILARVIQHEIDHLNGVLFVDRVQNAIALRKELTKHGFSVDDVQSVK